MGLRESRSSGLPFCAWQQSIVFLLFSACGQGSPPPDPEPPHHPLIAIEDANTQDAGGPDSTTLDAGLLSADTQELPLQAGPTDLPPSPDSGPVNANAELRQFATGAIAVAVVRCNAKTYRSIADSPYVVTDIALSIVQTVSGTPASSVTIYGGVRTDGSSVFSVHAPRLTIGQTYLAFYLPTRPVEFQLQYVIPMIDLTHFVLIGETLSLQDVEDAITSAGSAR